VDLLLPGYSIRGGRGCGPAREGGWGTARPDRRDPV